MMSNRSRHSIFSHFRDFITNFNRKSLNSISKRETIKDSEESLDNKINSDRFSINLNWDQLDEELDEWEPNNDERELLRSTWSDDFDFLFTIGSNIYVGIFEKVPNVQKLFLKLIKYGDRWKESKEFRSQALKFVQVLSLTIGNLHNIIRVKEILQNVGKKHTILVKRGFRPEYWDVFHDVMQTVISDHVAAVLNSNEKQMLALNLWKKLTHFIMRQMRKGFKEGMRK